MQWRTVVRNLISSSFQLILSTAALQSSLIAISSLCITLLSLPSLHLLGVVRYFRWLHLLVSIPWVSLSTFHMWSYPQAGHRQTYVSSSKCENWGAHSKTFTFRRTDRFEFVIYHKDEPIIPSIFVVYIYAKKWYRNCKIVSLHVHYRQTANRPQISQRSEALLKLFTFDESDYAK